MGRSLQLPLLATLALALIALGALFVLPDRGESEASSAALAPRVEGGGAAGKGSSGMAAEVELVAPPAAQEQITTVRSGARARLLGGVRGRVISDQRDRPLPGVIVVLTRRDLTPLRVTTHDDGTFETELDLLAPFAGAVTARALPPAGLVSPLPVSLNRAQLFGDEGLVLRLARGRTAAVSGAVIYKRTGDVVTDVRVRVSHSAAMLEETVEVDELGKFSTELTFPAGDVSVVVFDLLNPGKDDEGRKLGSQAGPHLEQGDNGTSRTVELDLGPTIHVADALGAPLPQGPWQARIVARAPADDWAGVLLVSPSGRYGIWPSRSLDAKALGQLRARAESLMLAGFDVSDFDPTATFNADDALEQEWS